MSTTVIEHGEMTRQQFQDGFFPWTGRIAVWGLGMIVGVDFSVLASSLAGKISAD